MYLYHLIEGECDCDGHEGRILLGHKSHFTEEEFRAKVVDVIVDAWVRTVMLAAEGKASKWGTSRWSELMPQVADMLSDRHGFHRMEIAVEFHVESRDLDSESTLRYERENQYPNDSNRRWLALAEALHAAHCFKDPDDGAV